MKQNFCKGSSGRFLHIPLSTEKLTKIYLRDFCTKQNEAPEDALLKQIGKKLNYAISTLND